MDKRIRDALRLVRDAKAFGGAAYSANLGEVPMADGGEVVERAEWNPFPGLKIKPPAEKLSDEPDIREYQLARHAHEFEGAPDPEVPKRKVVLDAPLLGGKKELGELPYDYQPIVQKALNLIYGQKTLPLYENPLTALLGRAIDAYETAKFIQRDPTDLANYTGVPGVVYGAGKLAAPAIGAGASAAVASDEERPVARDPEVDDALRIAHKSGGGAWTRKEGQNPEGGLNAKGRAAAKREGHNLKPPAPHPKTERDAARRRSFCARMSGMKSKLTSSKTAKDPDSRINKSLRAWNCADGGAVDEAVDLAQRKSGGKAVWNKPRPKNLGESEPLSSSQKASAKARAKAAGRPYPNLVDNMAAARKGK